MIDTIKNYPIKAGGVLIIGLSLLTFPLLLFLGATAHISFIISYTVSLAGTICFAIGENQYCRRNSHRELISEEESKLKAVFIVLFLAMAFLNISVIPTMFAVMASSVASNLVAY